MNITCLIGRHNLGSPRAIGGYRLGMADKAIHGHQQGTIYCSQCRDCSTPVLVYHPEVDYIALSRNKVS